MPKQRKEKSKDLPWTNKDWAAKKPKKKKKKADWKYVERDDSEKTRNDWDWGEIPDDQREDWKEKYEWRRDPNTFNYDHREPFWLRDKRRRKKMSQGHFYSVYDYQGRKRKTPYNREEEDKKDRQHLDDNLWKP